MIPDFGGCVSSRLARMLWLVDVSALAQKSCRVYRMGRIILFSLLPVAHHRYPPPHTLESVSKLPSMCRRRRLAGLYLFFLCSPVFSLQPLNARRVSPSKTVHFASVSSSDFAADEDAGVSVDETTAKFSKNHRQSRKNSGVKTYVNQATIQFNNQLNAMAKNFDKHSAQKAEDLLRDTLRNIQMGLELEIQPNVVTFTAVINAWARSRRHDAAERAEAILQWMLELSSATKMIPSNESLSVVDDEVNLTDFLVIKPNCIAFNAAITAWIRSPSKGSHNHAERLMNQLWDLYMASNQDPELKPNARTFNSVINAIARSREPNCGDRAATLLQRMEDLYTAGDEEMEPEARTFGAIINAYANDSLNDPRSTDKAAQMLQQMNSMYQLGYKGVKPNTFVYNACLNAFAKSEGNADQATSLLEMMEQQYAKGDLSLKPDVISYSTCINAHANSKTLQSGPMGEAVLKRMTQRFLLEGDETVKPNAVACTATIKAWMTSAAVAAQIDEEDSSSAIIRQASERAEDILTNMCLQYLAGDEDQKPTKVTFDLVHDALERVGNKIGVEKIVKLRRRILDHKLPRREVV